MHDQLCGVGLQAIATFAKRKIFRGKDPAKHADKECTFRNAVVGELVRSGRMPNRTEALTWYRRHFFPLYPEHSVELQPWA